MGLVNAVVISLIILAIISIRLAQEDKSISPVRAYYLNFAITTFILTTIIIACGDPLLYNLHYWVPVVPLFFPILGMLIPDTESDSSARKIVNTITYVYISFAFIFMAIGTYKYPIDPSESFMADRSEYLPCRDFLIQSGYTEGFAPFWIGNQLVELCNGKIDIWVESNEEMRAVDSTDSIYQFLQSVEHTSTLPKGKFFVATYGRVLDDPEYGINCPLFLSDDFMIYADNYITIYGFNSLDEYRAHIDSLQ